MIYGFLKKITTGVLEFLVHILLENHPVPLVGWHLKFGPS